MTKEEIIAFAKEKFDKDLTQEEAQAYLDKKLPLPDEAMELVSGGGDGCIFTSATCWNCGKNTQIVTNSNGDRVCEHCGHPLGV